MNERILEKLAAVTEEEKKILGGGKIDKSIYSTTDDFTIEVGKISEWEKLIDMRPHTRFAPFPEHRHNYIELIYNCKGETVHTVNSSEKIRLREGEMLLLGTNAVHAVDMAGEGDIAVNFIIKPEFFSTTMESVGYGNTIYNYVIKELNSSGDGGFMLFRCGDNSVALNLVENLIYSFTLKNKVNYAAQNLTMALLFGELSEISDVTDGYSDKYEKEIIFKTARYIDSSFKDAKLSDLSKKLNVSTVNLSKIIKKNLGVTFKSMLQKKRLGEAEKLIKNTDIPITEIIFSVGYENTNFFYRMFSSRYGCSPKVYRKLYSTKIRVENSVAKIVK